MQNKKCKICRRKFDQFNSLQLVCSPSCALKYAKKKNAQKLKDEKRKNRLQKEQLKNKHTLTKEAQTAFNAYIRQRDFGLPCISCNKSQAEIESHYSRGGYWDAGHYLSRGARPEHRFNVDNCHKQCKACNGGSGKWSKKNETVQTQYRLNLIKKISLQKVVDLECDHDANHYTHDDLRKIKALYKQKLRELSNK